MDFDAGIIFEFRYIGQPFPIRGFCCEVPVQYVLCNILRICGPPGASVVRILNCGLDAFLSADS